MTIAIAVVVSLVVGAVAGIVGTIFLVAHAFLNS